MQGSKLGPTLINNYIDLLIDLNQSQMGVRVGEVEAAALGFADIILLADKPSSLQGLLDICTNWSDGNEMKCNKKKC